MPLNESDRRRLKNSKSEARSGRVLSRDEIRALLAAAEDSVREVNRRLRPSFEPTDEQLARRVR